MSKENTPSGSVIALYSSEDLSNTISPLTPVLENPSTAQTTSPALKTAGGTSEVFIMARDNDGLNIMTIISGFSTFSSQYSVEINQIIGDDTSVAYQRQPISSEDKGFLEVFYPQDGTGYSITIQSLVDNPDDFYVTQINLGEHRNVVSVENVTTSIENVSGSYVRRDSGLSLHTVGGLPLDPRDMYLAFTNGSPSMSGIVKKDQFKLGMNFSFTNDGTALSGDGDGEGSFSIAIGSSLLSSPINIKNNDIVNSFPALEKSIVVRIRFAEDILKYPESNQPLTMMEVSLSDFYVLV